MCDMWPMKTNRVAAGASPAVGRRGADHYKPGRPARLAAFLFTLLTTPALFAQPTVTLELQTGKPYVNETILVKIQVQNAQEVEQPKFPKLPNCTVRYIGPESEFRMETDSTGRSVTVRRRAYQYTLTARKPGRLTIPAIPVLVDGKTLKTKPRHLVVRELSQSPSPRGNQSGDAGHETDELLFAEITSDQSKLFVGQRGRFTLAIWIKRAEYNHDPLNLSDMLRFLSGSFAPFDTQNIQRRVMKRRMADGSTHMYYVIELNAEFILDQPGPPNFDSVGIHIDYPLRYSRTFFNDVQVRRKVPVSVRPTVTVTDVQRLPIEGRPANFSGAVGRYAINTFAVPSNVRIGDPIKLVIDISGDPIETIPGPDLTSITKLTDDFRVPTETLAGSVSGKRKRFTQTIRAKRADVTEIPPIEFAYFDPHTEQYVVTRGEPIPVLVSVVEQLDASDLTGIADQPPQARNGTLQARDGLRGNKTGQVELLAIVRPVTMTQVLLTTAIPPVAFVCVWGFSALTRSGRDQAVKRRRGALRIAERRIHDALANKLPPGEFHGEIAAALAGYIADRLNEPPARFLGPAAVSFLQERGVNDNLVQRCAALLERCEQAAYAGIGDSDTSLADAARQCIKQLERERL